MAFNMGKEFKGGVCTFSEKNTIELELNKQNKYISLDTHFHKKRLIIRMFILLISEFKMGICTFSGKKKQFD